MIITGRSSDIVLQRGSELGIKDIYQGVIDKIEKMQSVAPDLSKVAYIGDDINDLSCMLLIKEAGGLVGCPKNAARQVIEVSDYIADHNGGEGAVRDFIEWLLDESQ